MSTETESSVLKDIARPYIHGAKHIAAVVGLLLAVFALMVITSAIFGDVGSLLAWGIPTIILYRVIRHRFF